MNFDERDLDMKNMIGKQLREIPAEIANWYPVIDEGHEIINWITAEWDYLLETTKEYKPDDLDLDEELKAAVFK